MLAQSEKPALADLQLSDPALLKTRSYISGQWVASADARAIEVTDPAIGMLIGSVPAMDAVGGRASVATARVAFPGWSSRLPQERAAILRAWFELIVANGENLARILTCEQGKPLSEARGEIAYAASFVEFYAEEAKRTNLKA